MNSAQEIQTILFVDTVGSSELYSKIGDVEAKKIISAELSRMMDMIRNHQGTIIKTIGDEIMCTFKDPNAAVRASFKMLEGLGFSQLGSENAETLSVKIGFNTGPVIPENGDVFGHAVNLAARMVQQAKSKQILTTRETIDLLDAEFRDHSRFVDQTTVKGIQDEVVIWEVLWSSDTLRTTILFDPKRASSSDKSETRLILQYNDTLFILDKNKKTLKFGRDDGNDIKCSDIGVSRLHCRIEWSKTHFVLIDNSTNGTYILPSSGSSVHCRRDEFVLDDAGMIRLGTPFEFPAAHKIEYHLQKSQ